MARIKVNLESGPFHEIDLEPNHALVIKPSITSGVLVEGECFCMGQRLEVGKKVYFKPFSDTMLFTLNSPCKLSFKTPLSYTKRIAFIAFKFTLCAVVMCLLFLRSAVHEAAV